MLTRIAARHRAGLVEVLERTPEFTPAETAVALELIDLGIARRDDYRFLVDEDEGGRVRGYVCFGPTPLTRGTFDLYWIAVLPACKGHGIGRALVAKMESELRAEGGRLVRVETAGLDAYEATRAFYGRVGYEELSRIRDFYEPGNDLVTYGRYL